LSNLAAAEVGYVLGESFAAGMLAEIARDDGRFAAARGARFRNGIAARKAAKATAKALVDDYCEVVKAALCGDAGELLR
jgi:hypothetical protein